MDDLYLWFKALHIIAVIAWMAGLFYLPRLFVYHVDAEIGSVQSETFKVMERKLLNIITTPAMIVSWVFGLLVAWQGDFFFDTWFFIKLVFVLALSGFHGFLAKTVKVFAADANQRPGKFYRMINEIPTLIMIAVVILVIFKPF